MKQKFGRFVRKILKTKKSKDNHLNICAIICSTSAVSLRQVLGDKYPVVIKIPFNHWRFCVSVLMFRIFMDVIHSSNFTDKEKDSMIEKNYKTLVEEYSDFSNGLKHLTDYIEKFKDCSPQSLGFWLSTNLFGKDSSSLTKEEFEVGVLATQMAMIDANSFSTR